MTNSGLLEPIVSMVLAVAALGSMAVSGGWLTWLPALLAILVMGALIGGAGR